MSSMLVEVAQEQVSRALDAAAQKMVPPRSCSRSLAPVELPTFPSTHLRCGLYFNVNGKRASHLEFTE